MGAEVGTSVEVYALVMAVSANKQRKVGKRQTRTFNWASRADLQNIQGPRYPPPGFRFARMSEVGSPAAWAAAAASGVNGLA
jgi:hypothetical protein